METIKTFISEQKHLGKALELGCGNGTYSKILIHEAACFVSVTYKASFELLFHASTVTAGSWKFPGMTV
ncbi:MAG: hypothetical protein GY749_00115 [Desulfobacteraceae bacterium]|nr:hypothetical protein [Desulfobacteraceae bacterium]